MPFQFTQLGLPGVVLIEPRVFPDTRGFFMETYKQHDFVAAGLGDHFVQENHSRSAKGTLRGLHFQRPPKAQAKLVRVLAGQVFDVSVDLRPDAPTFGRWIGVTLSAENGRMVYIPSWCAHGFCVLSDTADVLYKTSAEYARELEAGIVWDDPTIGIDWPVRDPLLSDRDRALPRLYAAVNVASSAGTDA